MRSILTIAFLILLASAEKFAVLLSASKGYINYAHQADVCHTYQTLIRNAILPENIITLSTNDAAFAEENPLPSQLFNAPGEVGFDVLQNCQVDHTDLSVTADKFLSVLKGEGHGKVLRSGRHDDVFLYVTGYGGSQFLEMPDRILFAEELVETIRFMKINERFRRMFIFYDVPEGASMFAGLSRDLETYVIASSPDPHRSFMAFCQPGDQVNGEQVSSCLGTLNTVSLLQYLDSSDSRQITLSQLFDYLHSTYPEADIKQIGDMQVAQESVESFLGFSTLFFTDTQTIVGTIPAHDNEFNYHLSEYLITEEKGHGLGAMSTVMNREKTRSRFHKIAAELTRFPERLYEGQGVTGNFVCYSSALRAYQEDCDKLTPYSMQYAKIFANACQQGINQRVITKAIYKSCQIETDWIKDLTAAYLKNQFKPPARRLMEEVVYKEPVIPPSQPYRSHPKPGKHIYEALQQIGEHRSNEIINQFKEYVKDKKVDQIMGMDPGKTIKDILNKFGNKGNQPGYPEQEPNLSPPPGYGRNLYEQMMRARGIQDDWQRFESEGGNRRMQQRPDLPKMPNEGPEQIDSADNNNRRLIDKPDLPKVPDEVPEIIDAEDSDNGRLLQNDEQNRRLIEKPKLPEEQTEGPIIIDSPDPDRRLQPIEGDSTVPPPQKLDNNDRRLDAPVEIEGNATLPAPKISGQSGNRRLDTIEGDDTMPPPIKLPKDRWLQVDEPIILEGDTPLPPPPPPSNGNNRLLQSIEGDHTFPPPIKLPPNEDRQLQTNEPILLEGDTPLPPPPPPNPPSGGNRRIQLVEDVPPLPNPTAPPEGRILYEVLGMGNQQQ